MTAHHCHAFRCKTPCAAKMLMCRPCWALVSPATQAAVYRTVSLRGRRVDESWAPWWRASHQAIYEVSVATGGDSPFKQAWLAKQMAFANKLVERG